MMVFACMCVKTLSECYQSVIKVFKVFKVKPEVTATSEWRPPDYKGHHLKDPISILKKASSAQLSPANKLT